MSSPNKRKGTTWEVDLVDYLKSAGLPARRVAQSGMLDTGDVHGISPFVGQAKNYANLADGLRLGIAGVEAQRTRAGEPYGVVFAKRTRKGVAQGYAVMTVETFASVVLRLRAAESALGIQDE